MTDFYTYPTSDSDFGDWSNDYTYIDEVQDSEDEPDDGATYSQETSAGRSAALCNLLDHTSEEGTISNVRVYVRGIVGGGSGDFSTAINIGSTTDYGDVWTDSSYTTHYTDYAQNPDTSSAWTWTDIDNLKAGMYGQGGAGASRYARVTTVWIVVTYSAEAPETDFAVNIVPADNILNINGVPIAEILNMNGVLIG